MVEKLDMDLEAIHNTGEHRVKPTKTDDSHDQQPCFPSTTTTGSHKSRVSAFEVHQRRMPLDGDHSSCERDDLSDDESLFGSPPPSPITGKTSLALPSGGSDSEQNVGTLALPGSHNPSKLPVDSAVYLLDARHRPSETQSHRASNPQQMVTICATPPVPAVIGPDAGVGRSRSTTHRASKRGKRTRKSKSAASTTPGPSIELPPSDAPIPPNFLRNQQALLGIAGMVANISPASLSTRRHSQGNNANNPIVVEDEGATLHRFGRTAVPTPAQLLATLSSQRDLFPVLEQLLVILRRGTDPPVQPLLNLPQSPSKRRKLSRVPAGAADWDVPFPFPPGEGPPNYKEEWTNERCERLISDFIALLREGANKAAARASVKRATSQPAPQSSTQSHSIPSRWSLPPANGNHRSPSSNYAPLPLDAYLRPTVPYDYAAFTPTPAPVQSLGAVADLLTSTSDTVVPPQEADPFGLFMDTLLPGFDLDPLLLSLMGTGPPQEGLSEAQSPAPSEDTSTPSSSYSPCPSQTISSGPSPMTPNFDPSIAMFPLPSGSTAGQQDHVGIFGSAPPLRAQDGMEFGMDVDDDFSRVFGIEAGASRGVNAADQPPHFCDPSSMELPTFPGLELLSQPPDQAILSVNTPALSAPLSSMLSQEVSDIPSLSLSSRPSPFPSSSSGKLPAFSTSSLQRQRPVPKRPAPPTPPSKAKAAATLAVVKKRREDAIQQGRDLRRQLLADIGKSKVQLWELTMEQGVLTRMSKDERIKKC